MNGEVLGIWLEVLWHGSLGFLRLLVEAEKLSQLRAAETWERGGRTVDRYPFAERRWSP